MNSEEYREKFSDFLGDVERYRKFIEQLNSRGKNRLLYWQEKEIVAFSEASSIDVIDYEEALNIFNVCEVHGNELQEGSVKVFRGHIDCSRDYEAAIAQHFPNSYLDEVNGPSELYGKRIQIRFCPKCRETRNEWVNKHA